MAIKANRDLAVGLLILAMLATASTHALGWAMLAAATIPLLDGLTVLRSGGPEAIPFGVHHATAAVMLTNAHGRHDRRHGLGLARFVTSCERDERHDTVWAQTAD
jgi:hypothetical protein